MLLEYGMLERDFCYSISTLRTFYQQSRTCIIKQTLGNQHKMTNILYFRISDK